MRLQFLVPVCALLFVACGRDIASQPAAEVVHTGCTSDSDCKGDRCITAFPGGGMCTHDCAAGDECPEGTVCADTESSGGVCLFRCSSGAECRDLVGAGYACDTESDIDTSEDVRVCVD